MSWFYLSPHLDDAALSCGGLIWEQTHSGNLVQVWTLCAGDPPPGPLSTFAESLHLRWGTGPRTGVTRREEDLRTCAVLGATARHFSNPDCIYRRSSKTGEALYPSEESIFGPVHPEDALLASELAQQISQAVMPGADIVCPLALGGHVDHRLVRAAAEKAGCGLWYYADYPYVLEEGISPSFIPMPGCEARLFPITREGLTAWTAAIAAYASQISTFWPDLISMQTAIERYCSEQGGVRLWHI
jgi:LmbE family N-acetylglucosaminyl deacetylase